MDGRSTRQLMMGIVLAMSAWSAPSVRAAEGEPGPVLPPEVELGGEVTVEVASDVFEGETLRGWVRERSLATLESRVPLRTGDRIVIAVEGMPLDYVLQVTARRWGKILSVGSERVECSCTADELLAAVERLVEQAAIELERSDQVEREQMERKRFEREQAQRAERTRRERRRRDQGEALAQESYRPARLGLGGAIGTGLGGALLVTGFALIAWGDGPAPDNDLLERTNVRPSGWVVLGVGATVFTTGVALLVVDAVRCRKDRVRCGQRGSVFDRARRSGPREVTWR